MLALDLFRYTNRLKVLTFAIGVCVAFIVGSFAFANGLGLTVKGISDKFVNEGALVYEGADLEGSLINLTEVDIDKDYAKIGMCTAPVNGTDRIFFAVIDPKSVLRQNLDSPDGQILSGYVDPISGPITFDTSSGSVTLYANQSYSSGKFPAFWNLISWGDLLRIRPEMEQSASFLVFASIDVDLEGSLRDQGLTVQMMTGILDYFNAGSMEVTSDLWLIILPSSFIVALLVYSAMSMEIRDRAKEIAILKTIGANNQQIRGIFLFQAVILSILGAVVGIMIGIIVSYAISTSSSVAISQSVFFLRVTESSMAVAFVSTIAAGLLGSLAPIYQTVRRSVKEALR
jgi:hypothetical protein